VIPLDSLYAASVIHSYSRLKRGTFSFQMRWTSALYCDCGLVSAVLLYSRSLGCLFTLHHSISLTSTFLLPPEPTEHVHTEQILQSYLHFIASTHRHSYRTDTSELSPLHSINTQHTHPSSCNHTFYLPHHSN